MITGYPGMRLQDLKTELEDINKKLDDWKDLAENKNDPKYYDDTQIAVIPYETNYQTTDLSKMKDWYSGDLVLISGGSNWGINTTKAEELVTKFVEFYGAKLDSGIIDSRAEILENNASGMDEFSLSDYENLWVRQPKQIEPRIKADDMDSLRISNP